ncbi:unnamed protein product [Oikopleura dioica]|uniref:Uncharacterized protein n=1 Tax=Oikopleura dioica TaxID=34765 RepID=E4X6M7_OIKDI|nr:unnamed protein product [Oikopleura dioica]
MPKNAGKAAKARKSSHKKSRVAKAVREAVIESKESSKKTKKLPRRVSSANDEDKENDEVFERAPADFNEEIEWDIEGFGGIYLVWGKRRQRDPDGSIKTKFYLKHDEEHRIWVKWTVAFDDGIRWSAEKQSFLVGVSQDTIKDIIRKKQVWPLPVRGEQGWKERKEICQKLKITEWKPTAKEEKGNWQLLNPELPVTQSEIEETDDETDEDDST